MVKQGIQSDSLSTKQNHSGFDFKTRLFRLESNSSRQDHSNYRFNIRYNLPCPSKRSESTTPPTDAQLTFCILDQSVGQPSYSFSSINLSCYLRITQQVSEKLRPEIYHTLMRSPDISMDSCLRSTHHSKRGQKRRQLGERVLHICTSLFTKPKRLGKDIDAVLALEEVTQKESPKEFHSRLSDIATKSQLHSKMVQHYLKNIPPDQAIRAAASFRSHICKLLWNEFGHHVLRSAILISPALADDCQQVCEVSFLAVAKCSYSVSVAKKLASIKPDFCEFGLKYFSEHLRSTISESSAQVLLSSLITNAPREDLLLFLLPSLEHSLEARKADCPLMRILSILIDRLIDPYFIERAALISLPHLDWMIDDPTGNYAIQSFIKKNSPTVVKKLQMLCLKQPELLITNRYRRYILLGLLGIGGHEAFITKALLAMTETPLTKDAIHSMLGNKRNIHLYFLALLAAEGFDHDSFELVCSSTEAWGSSHSRTSSCSEWKLLSGMVASLRRRDYVTIIDMLSRITIAGQLTLHRL